MAKKKSKRKATSSVTKSSSLLGTRNSQGPSSAASPAALSRELDRLDRQLVQQLNERAEIARELECDQAQNTDSRATEPNEVARAAQRNPGPLSDGCVRAVFRELASGCRELRQQVRVAYLGPQYSYSHLAAIQRFGQSAELIPVTTIEAVLDAVNREDVQFGLVPLENSTDGRIADTLDVFVRMPVRISGEVPLRIHHNLLGKCRREDVREVHSKPQALSQCRNWLSRHLPGARVVETTSTTAAAELAATKPGVAAIASLQAGVNYELDVLAAHIEDNPHNVTRFAVMGHAAVARTGRDVTNLMFQLVHEPGALADAMAIFKRNRLNLTWIESFPLAGSNNEYLFFVELEGYETDVRVRRAITSLRRKTKRLEILGSYARAEPID